MWGGKREWVNEWVSECCVCVFIWACVHPQTFLSLIRDNSIRKWTYLSKYMHISMFWYTSVFCVKTHTHTHTHAHTYIYACVYVYIYIYIYSPSKQWSRERKMCYDIIKQNFSGILKPRLTKPITNLSTRTSRKGKLLFLLSMVNQTARCKELSLWKLFSQVPFFKSLW